MSEARARPIHCAHIRVCSETRLPRVMVKTSSHRLPVTFGPANYWIVVPYVTAPWGLAPFTPDLLLDCMDFIPSEEN